jgi:imidazolonepropionase
LPEVAREQLATACDVFVEHNAFSVEDARPMLARAKDLGLAVRVHAEQLSHQRGAQLACELGALSAGHLEFVTEDDARALAKAGVVCEVLSLAQVFLRGQRAIPGRMLADAGCTIAVATDVNPGTAMSTDLHLAAGLSVTQSGLTAEEALRGITVNAARALGLQDRGVVAQGMRADLVVLDAASPVDVVYRWSDVTTRAVVAGGKLAWRNSA